MMIKGSIFNHKNPKIGLKIFSKKPKNMQQKMLKYVKNYPKNAFTFYVMLIYYEKSPKKNNNYFSKLE